jgi:hypothetical protein
MEKSYLVEIIKNLRAEELPQLSLFLNSAYFVQGVNSKEIQALCQIILDAAPHFSEASLNKETVYRQMFPGKELVEGKLKKVMSELNKLIRTFLLVRQYLHESNEFQHQLDIARQLRLRGMVSRHKQTIEKLKNAGAAAVKESHAQYQQDYLLEYEIHDLESAYNQGKGDINIPNVVYYLEMHYFTNRLEYLNRFLLQQKVTQIETPEVIKVALNDSHIPDFYLERSVLLLITDKIHRLLQLPHASVEDFRELMLLLQQHEQELDPNALMGFYTYLRNFIVLLIDAGANDFVLVLHHLQQDNLARGYFYHNGRIPPNAYLNINKIALRAEDIDWAMAFTESHKEKLLAENNTDEFYHLNLANCLFAQKKFQEALEVIPFGSSYSFYHLAARKLELKIYYELQSDLLPYKIDAFKMYISRASHKFLSDNLRELHTNFGNVIYQLSLSPKQDATRSARMVQRILDKKLIAERNWLLEKAQELA